MKSIKTAYSAVVNPISQKEQDWRDIDKINFLDIFVTKLNNLTNAEATFDIESDSSQVEKIKELCADLEVKRFNITAAMLADGDYFVFPTTTEKGEIIHSYLTQQQIRILNTDGDKITEAYGIIDWYINEKNKIFYLLRHHILDENGTLRISYVIVDDNGKNATVEKWNYLNNAQYAFTNANHIGFGRYKSPADSRGYSLIYGVPLNFGCADVENELFYDLKLIHNEFKNGKSVIFTDPRNILKRNELDGYEIAENIIPIKSRAGQDGANIDIFNPNLRYSEHYSKLIGDMSTLEKLIGTSKGILTENETSYTATATAVKRANADTIALIGKIRNAIDAGNKDTLEADGVFLNISPELYTYTSDWYDPFEDAAEQWQRLLEAKNNGAAELSDLIRFNFPNLTPEEIEEKIQRINEENTYNVQNSVERILSGG